MCWAYRSARDDGTQIGLERSTTDAADACSEYERAVGGDVTLFGTGRLAGGIPVTDTAVGSGS
jgi:hypothetical protein